MMGSMSMPECILSALWNRQRTRVPPPIQPMFSGDLGHARSGEALCREGCSIINIGTPPLRLGPPTWFFIYYEERGRFRDACSRKELGSRNIRGNVRPTKPHPLIIANDATRSPDEDAGKGAVEQDRPGQRANVSQTGQLGHRDPDPLVKSSDSDFPEAGQNEEHTGEPQTKNQLNRDTESGCAGDTQDADPGFRQKENQNKEKHDPLAA
jgi:hypothetical protein